MSENNSDHRVVVTGMGVTTPMGCTVEQLWEGLLAGRLTAHRIKKFDALISELDARQVTHWRIGQVVAGQGIEVV